jgi:hypothetical protein
VIQTHNNLRDLSALRAFVVQPIKTLATLADLGVLAVKKMLIEISSRQ